MSDPNWAYSDEDYCSDPNCVGMEASHEWRSKDGKPLCSACAFDTVGSYLVGTPADGDPLHLNEKEISLLSDVMRAGIEFWQGLVAAAKEECGPTHPVIAMMEDQIARTVALKEKFEDAEKVVVS